MAKKKEYTLTCTPSQKSRVAALLKECLKSNWKELEEIIEAKDEEREKLFVNTICVAILALGAKEFVEMCKAYPDAVGIEGDEAEIIKVLHGVVQKYRETQKFEDLVQGRLTQPFKD